MRTLGRRWRREGHGDRAREGGREGGSPSTELLGFMLLLVTLAAMASVLAPQPNSGKLLLSSSNDLDLLLWRLRQQRVTSGKSPRKPQLFQLTGPIAVSGKYGLVEVSKSGT